jgi:hypothetical protein
MSDDLSGPPKLFNMSAVGPRSSLDQDTAPCHISFTGPVCPPLVHYFYRVPFPSLSRRIAPPVLPPPPTSVRRKAGKRQQKGWKGQERRKEDTTKQKKGVWRGGRRQDTTRKVETAGTKAGRVGSHASAPSPHTITQVALRNGPLRKGS